jgi:hypothetical protein
MTRESRRIPPSGLTSLASARLEYLLGLDREAKSYFGGSVENLKNMIAGQSTELAFGPRPGGQFNAAVARMTFGASDVGLSHDWALGRFYIPDAPLNRALADSKQTTANNPNGLVYSGRLLRLKFSSAKSSLAQQPQ